MVFERLFPDSLLERKEWTAFLLAVIYSTLSILIAHFLFPANSGIVSVIFVSIFLLPYFQTILKREERQERKEKKQTFLHLLHDNLDAIQVYLFLFFGVYLTYMAYTFLAPSLGYDVSSIFREQLSLDQLHGGAVFSGPFLVQVLFNNWWVLLACFLIGLVVGDGAVFFIVWNASTWGSVFGYRAIMASANTHEGALLTLLLIVLITLPHVLLEGLAYILAALSGSVLSDEIIEKSDEVQRFVIYFVCTALVYGVVFMMAYLALGTNTARATALLLCIAVGLAMIGLYAMHMIFSSPLEQKVFRYNFYLFLGAVGIFVLGAFVEVLVLANSTVLRAIYAAAF